MDSNKTSIRSAVATEALVRGFTTGIEFTVAICGMWLAVVLGLAIAALVMSGASGTAAAAATIAGITAAAAFFPARAFQNVIAALTDQRRTTGAFRQGLLLALFTALAMLWLGTVGFVNIARGLMTAPAAVPLPLVWTVIVAGGVATLAVAASVVVMWRRQFGPRPGPGA